MPLLYIGVGALLGGGTVFVLSDTGKKIAMSAAVIGGAYWYLKKGKK